jgi:hypothetical protein
LTFWHFGFLHWNAKPNNMCQSYDRELHRYKASAVKFTTPTNSLARFRRKNCTVKNAQAFFVHTRPRMLYNVGCDNFQKWILWLEKASEIYSSHAHSHVPSFKVCLHPQRVSCRVSYATGQKMDWSYFCCCGASATCHKNHCSCKYPFS